MSGVGVTLFYEIFQQQKAAHLEVLNEFISIETGSKAVAANELDADTMLPRKWKVNEEVYFLT